MTAPRYLSHNDIVFTQFLRPDGKRRTVSGRSATGERVQVLTGLEAS